MITVQAEKWSDNVPRLREMFPEHWKELALYQDKTPLGVNWDAYHRTEEDGRLVFIGLRKDGVLMGYFVGFLVESLHYSGCSMCIMDIFYLHPSVRGKGMNGVKLFRAAEVELRRLGVEQWFVGSKVKADASALFRYLKFEPAEAWFSKWIGG